MTKTVTLWISALIVLVCAGALQAHHSGAMYQRKPVWIEGKVVRFEHKNPHTIIAVEDRSETGQVREWSVEGPGQSQLERRGIEATAPQIGDTIKVCGFPYKSVEELSRIFPEADFSGRVLSTQTLAGHVIEMPGGKKRFWEPHGVLAECIRSSDEPQQSWIDFLNSDARARDNWCEQRSYKPAQRDASLLELIEEINGRLDNPCP